MSVPDPEHADVIKDGDLLPGDTVSTDQYECRVRGRLPNTRCKEDPLKNLVVVRYLLIMHPPK